MSISCGDQLQVYFNLARTFGTHREIEVCFRGMNDVNQKYAE